MIRDTKIIVKNSFKELHENKRDEEIQKSRTSLINEVCLTLKLRSAVNYFTK